MRGVDFSSIVFEVIKTNKNNKGNNFSCTKTYKRMKTTCFAFWCFFSAQNVFVKKRPKIVLITSNTILLTRGVWNIEECSQDTSLKYKRHCSGKKRSTQIQWYKWWNKSKITQSKRIALVTTSKHSCVNIFTVEFESKYMLPITHAHKYLQFVHQRRLLYNF